MRTCSTEAFHRRVAVVLTITLIVLCGYKHAKAQPHPSNTPYEVSIWVDPWSATAPKPLAVRELWSRTLDFVSNYRPARLILTTFANASTLYRTSSKIFRQGKQFISSTDPLHRLINHCTRYDVDVCALLELLLWHRLGAVAEGNIFAKHPELMESVIQFSCAHTQSNLYASPWHHQVRQALAELLQELCSMYVGLGGIVFDCHLSRVAWSGYSPPARAACIRALRIDPLDITGSDPEGSEGWLLVRKWFEWKRDSLGSLIANLGAIARKSRIDRSIAVIGRANFYRSSLGHRVASCADWAYWAANGWCDEVLLMDDWTDKANRGLLLGAKQLIEKLGVEVKLTPVIRTRIGLRRVDIQDVWVKLMGEGLEGFVIKVEDVNDIEMVEDFMRMWVNR